jgi:glucose/mannose-6-phosphate isomerase
MYGAIKNFHSQFEFRPKIENAARLVRRKKFLVAGMGGSHLAADLLTIWRPGLDIVVHSDYGLPPRADLRERRTIISSYSGNTEEALDAYAAARKLKLPMLAIATGGKLLQWAKRDAIPYITLPNLGIQPRAALGLSMLAFLAATGDQEGLREASALARTLRPFSSESKGRVLARALRGKIPVIYTSRRNAPIAYVWKIKLNETGKIPAFMNVVPELNHNEITGFYARKATRALVRPFHFVILKDKCDDARAARRLDLLAKGYRGGGLPVTILSLHDPNVFRKVFSSLVLADWVAYHIALATGADPEQVPVQERFKRLMR